MPKRWVWIVEMGSYSDHHILGIYTSRARAQGIVREVLAGLSRDGAPWEKPEINRYALDRWVDKHDQGLRPYTMTMNRNGTFRYPCKPHYDVPPDQQATFTLERPQGRTIERSLLKEAKAGGENGMALAAEVWALNERQAVRIVNEERVRLIALNKWE